MSCRTVRVRMLPAFVLERAPATRRSPGRRARRRAPTVADRTCGCGSGRSLAIEPVAHQALRSRHRQGREQRSARPGTDDASHAVGAIEPVARSSAAVSCPARIKASPTATSSSRGRELQGEVEESLSAGRQPQTPVHRRRPSLDSRRPWTTISARWGRTRRGVNATCGRKSALSTGAPEHGAAVPWLYAASVGSRAARRLQALAFVDGVVQPDEEPMGQPDEPRATELPRVSPAARADASREGRVEGARGRPSRGARSCGGASRRSCGSAAWLWTRQRS